MQLHWSHIQMYTKCAEQYRRRYIMGDKLPPGIALIAGSGFHTGVEKTLTHKLETGELPPIEQTTEAACDKVKDMFNDEVFLNDDEQQEGVDKLKGIVIDTAVKCASVHHQILAPQVNPKHIERKWVLEIPQLSMELAGTIDCDEGDIVDDWKTAAKSPRDTEADESGQLTMYSMAKYFIDGNIPKSRLGFVIKTKEPKAKFQETTRTKEDFEPLLKIIGRVREGIEKQVFPFASSMSPRPFYCCPKYCGYYKTCEGVCGKKVFNGGIE